MKTKLYYFLSLALAATVVFSCQKNAEDLPYKGDSLSLPSAVYNYANPDVPANFQDVVSDPKFRVTDDGATLGRVLFYDKKLSLNNKISCGSCHLQEKAFADAGAGSIGFDGKTTSRNSLAILNPVMETNFFWDLRENDLNQMVLKPIKNHIEMGMEDLDKLSGKLAAAEYYPGLFEKAFGTPDISKERIGDALAQFLRSMLTLNSKADVALNSFTQKETMGMNLFFGKALCASCHGGRNFNEGGSFIDPNTGGWDSRNSANIGLEIDYTDPGMGVNRPDLEGIFKVPSLRNIALTAPYMHDGRFATLMDVVNQYNGNIQDHPNLDPRLRDWNGDPWRLQLTNDEKEALVAFLETLTDVQFTKDERFSDPFAK